MPLRKSINVAFVLRCSQTWFMYRFSLVCCLTIAVLATAGNRREILLQYMEHETSISACRPRQRS